MTYARKFYITLGVAVLGALLLLMGKDQVQVEYTDHGIVFGNYGVMLVGFLLFCAAAPLCFYYYSRKNAPRHPVETEIEALKRKYPDQ